MVMKFNIITLGCKVNSYESNFMKESLINNGFSFCSDNEKCDILILNIYIDLKHSELM